MSGSSGAVRGYNSTVEIIVGSESPTTTEIVGIETFDFPDQTRGNVDVTHLRSPGDTEEAIPDMKKLAEWPLSHHYVPGSDMDVALAAVDGSGETFILKITAAGAAARQYTAYLNGYVPKGISPKGVMMAQTTFTVMSEIVV